MTLRTTNAGLALIGAFEGTKLKGYRCPAGKPTIGRGMTSDAIAAAGETVTYRDGTRSAEVIIGKSITAREEDRLFRAVVDHFENAIERLLGRANDDARPCEFDALVSLTWNIGIGNFGKSSALRLFKKGDKRGAASQILAWNRATIDGRKVRVAGLVRRREAERLLFLGDYKAAAALAHTDLGPMPQQVEAPEKREPITKSPTGAIHAGEVVAGGAATAGGVAKSVNDSHVADKARDIAEKASDAAATATQLGDAAGDAGTLFGVSGSTALIIFAGLVILGLAGWGLWRRWRRSRDEDSIHLDHEEIELARDPEPVPVKTRRRA